MLYFMKASFVCSKLQKPWTTVLEWKILFALFIQLSFGENIFKGGKSEQFRVSRGKVTTKKEVFICSMHCGYKFCQASVSITHSV